MKKIVFLLFTGLAIASCQEHSGDVVDYDMPLDKEAINANAKKVFETIDPSQNWSSITKGSVTVTADANMENIVEVQILTESPFGNKNAVVLNRASVTNNESALLVYDAPKIYDVLFAACVDNKGNYFVKAFSTSDNEVSFAQPATSRMTRAEETFPALSSIVLGEPAKSFNALRAEAAQTDGYVIVNNNAGGVDKGDKYKYTEWNDGTWLNDYLWAPEATTDAGWTIENGTIYKPIKNNNGEDLTTIQFLVRFYLPKTTGNTKTNNWKSIVEGTNYFKQYKNHFVSDGNPLTVFPLQMNSTEGQYNAIYYYYYHPDSVAGMNDEQLANYIKKLPKFKALTGFNGGSGMSISKKYLLPYYGDGEIKSGATPKSLNIPKGHRIGFLNQKTNGDSYNYCMNGCTYGYGPLNKENNHIYGHYFSAVSNEVSQEVTKVWTDKGQEKSSTSTINGPLADGMEWNSPRIGIFSANEKTFLCFEDGSDCNFSDMILEINSGIEINYDPIKPQAASYMMCFEDEPETADYDMNDVVLRGVRLNDTQIQITLVACGAWDELQIKGLQNTKKLGTKEVHKFFNVAPKTVFVNTKKGENYFTPVSETFNIDKAVSVEDFMKMITINNLTTKKTIAMPKEGEPPYAIIVPLNFRYPLETWSITKAYPDFVKWAANRNEATDWYLNGNESLLYPNMFEE